MSFEMADVLGSYECRDWSQLQYQGEFQDRCQCTASFVRLCSKEADHGQGLTRRFQSGYQLSLLAKDMKIAKTVIESTGVESGLSDLIVSRLSAADQLSGPGADHTQCIELWERNAGIQLKQSEGPK